MNTEWSWDAWLLLWYVSCNFSMASTALHREGVEACFEDFGTKSGVIVIMRRTASSGIENTKESYLFHFGYLEFESEVRFESVLWERSRLPQV